MKGATLALAVLVVIASGCTLAVEHGLDERAANEVVTALERAGIGATKSADESASPPTFTVEVGRNDGLRALEVLRAEGLPRGRRTGFGEVYGKPSLIPTATEERARYVEALQGEIARTLESVDGVATARVHLVLEERDPLAVDGKPRVPAQASVLLKTRTSARALDEASVAKLVAGSVPGLAPAAVTVVTTVTAEPRSDAPTLVAVGPLRVSPGSRTWLVAGLAATLIVVAGLAVLLIVTARRLSALERRLATRP